MIGSRVAKVEIKTIITISKLHFLLWPEKKLWVISGKRLSINIIHQVKLVRNRVKLSAI